MIEPVAMGEVFERMEKFKTDLPRLAETLCRALELVRFQGQQITTMENHRAFDRAKNELQRALSEIREGLHLIGDGANRARGGNLTAEQRDLCDFLYDTFMPRRDSAI